MKKRILDLEQKLAERKAQNKPGVIIVANRQEAAERAAGVRIGGAIIINDVVAMRAYVERKKEEEWG